MKRFSTGLAGRMKLNWGKRRWDTYCAILAQSVRIEYPVTEFSERRQLAGMPVNCQRRRTLAWPLLTSLFVVALCCTENDAITDREHDASYEIVVRASLQRLVATPELFDGYTVIVRGYMILEQGTARLLLLKEFADMMMLSEGVHLELTSEQFENYREYNGRYVVIEGIVSMYSGRYSRIAESYLTDIRRIEPIVTRDDLDKLQRSE